MGGCIVCFCAYEGGITESPDAFARADFEFAHLETFEEGRDCCAGDAHERGPGSGRCEGDGGGVEIVELGEKVGGCHGREERRRRTPGEWESRAEGAREGRGGRKDRDRQRRGERAWRNPESEAANVRSVSNRGGVYLEVGSDWEDGKGKEKGDGRRWKLMVKL